MTQATSTARQVCEDYLRDQIRINLQGSVLPSENEIAERLLKRGDELSGVYDEVYRHLYRDGISWKIFLGCLLTTGAFWSPERIAESRADREVLIELNKAIANGAHDLAELLTRRDDMHSRSAFTSQTHYDICAVIEEACAENYRYAAYLKEPLAELSARFDMKYWPLLTDCIQVIGSDAQRATVTATDPMTEAATRSTRPSKADFIRALREAIDENRGDWLGAITDQFGPSDDALATLANVLLDLPPEELVDATYVKNLRHRDRARIV